VVEVTGGVEVLEDVELEVEVELVEVVVEDELEVVGGCVVEVVVVVVA
jgi:hypothetical protein